MKNDATGIQRLFKASQFSMSGLTSAFSSEAAFRQEVMALVIFVPAGIMLGQNGLERALLIFVLLLILVTELLNTGLEVVVDKFGAEYNALSGKAKDIGSAAVLVSLVNAVVVWVLILM